MGVENCNGLDELGVRHSKLSCLTSAICRWTARAAALRVEVPGCVFVAIGPGVLFLRFLDVADRRGFDIRCGF